MLARREANGRGQRGSRATQQAERADKIMGVVLAQPHRRGETSHLAESALGRLKLKGLIDDNQLNAGNRYAEIERRYKKHRLDSRAGYPQAPMADRVGGSSVDNSEIDPDIAIEAERAWNDVMVALAHAGLLLTGVRVLARLVVVGYDLENQEDFIVASKALGVLHQNFALEPRRRLTARQNCGMSEIDYPPMRLEA